MLGSFDDFCVSYRAKKIWVIVQICLVLALSLWALLGFWKLQRCRITSYIKFLHTEFEFNWIFGFLSILKFWNDFPSIHDCSDTQKCRSKCQKYSNLYQMHRKTLNSTQISTKSCVSSNFTCFYTVYLLEFFPILNHFNRSLLYIMV